MLYCPKCSNDYPDGKKFCKNCGTSLMIREMGPGLTPLSSPVIEKSPEKEKKLCPSCGTEQGSEQNFCKNCEASLTAKEEQESKKETIPKPFPGINVEPEPQKPVIEQAAEIPSRSKILALLQKKKKLLKAEEKVKALITNLEAQKGIISDEALHDTMRLYQDNLKAIENKITAIENYLADLREKITIEVGSLKKEIAPHYNHLQELKTIKKAKRLTARDYRRFKKDPDRKVNNLDSQIKKRQNILNLFSSSDKGSLRIIDSVPYLKLTGLIFAIVIVGGGGFFGYKYFFKKDMDGNISNIQSSKFLAFSTSASPTAAASREKEIRKLFETIKQANLTKDINLFISCYSMDFPDIEEKKNKTLQNWEAMDLNALNYSMRDLSFHQNTAEVTIDWLITTRWTENDQVETINTTNKVILRKEGDQWKIANLK